MALVKKTKALLWQKILEILIDLFLVILSFVLAYLTRVGFIFSTEFPFWPFFSLAIGLSPVFILMLMLSDFYALREISKTDLGKKIIIATASGTMFFIFIFFFRRQFFFSRLMVFYIFLYSSFLLFAFHYFMQNWEKKRHQQKKGILRTLIIGNGRAAEQIANKLFATGSRFQVVAAVAPYGGQKKEVATAPVLGKMDALESVVESENIEAIIQTEAIEHTLNVISFCEGKFLECLIAPQILGIFDERFLAEKIAGMSFIRLHISPLFGWGQVFKRFFDLYLSLLLMIIFSPILLFYKKAKIVCYKNTSEELFEKYEINSPNKLIRFLPEIINVLKGEMSFIGPRPHKVKESQSWPAKRRLLVRPGIFGIWQLKKLQGKANQPEEEFLADIFYIIHWDFWRDLKIFFQSLFLLITYKDSYQKEIADDKRKSPVD